MKRKLLCFGAGLTMALLSGCSLFENPSTFDPVELKPIQEEKSIQVVWSQSIGETNYAFKPAIVDSYVYAASGSGVLNKYDLATGRLIWSVNVGTKIVSGVGANEEVVVVSGKDGFLHAYSTSGQALWTQKTSSRVATPVVISSGVVVVRSQDARLEGFDAQTGQVLWGIMRSIPLMNVKITQSLAVSQGFVYAPMPNGRILKIEPRTGHVVWEQEISPIQGPIDLDSTVSVLGAPAISGAQLCAGTYQGDLACYVAQGQGFVQQFKLKFPVSAGVTQDQGYILASGMHGRLIALTAQRGQLLWVDESLKNRHLTNPVLVGDSVFVGDYQGYIHAFSLKDGHPVARTRLGNYAQVTQLQSTPYGVLIQTGSGQLMMIK